MSYHDFLHAKQVAAPAVGVDIDPGDLHPLLYDWQRESVAWALHTGRCALFWDCGLGKTFAQLEWARHSADTSLILAPLSVARQTVREARKLDLEVRYIRSGLDVTGPGIWITNIEMAQHFDPALFGAVVLDESSILRGQVIAAHQAAGWIFHGEVTVDKDPQAQAIRTKAQALMFNTLRRDSSMTRPALADYVLIFRKPGENPTPIRGDVDNETWIQWARPVWYDIRETDTLNARSGREDGDERHICPLQLPLIERCARLWSNPGETILSPFAGIGSEGVVALRTGRRFTGIELKRSYWQAAVKNLSDQAAKRTLDDLMELASCAGTPA